MAKQGKLQTFLEYAAAKSVLVTLGHLSPRTAMKFGRTIGRLAYTTAGNLRKPEQRTFVSPFPKSPTQNDRNYCASASTASAANSDFSASFRPAHSNNSRV